MVAGAKVNYIYKNAIKLSSMNTHGPIRFRATALIEFRSACMAISVELALPVGCFSPFLWLNPVLSWYLHHVSRKSQFAFACAL